jgi:hypothetical protein
LLHFFASSTHFWHCSLFCGFGGATTHTNAQTVRLWVACCVPVAGDHGDHYLLVTCSTSAQHRQPETFCRCCHPARQKPHSTCEAELSLDRQWLWHAYSHIR